MLIKLLTLWGVVVGAFQEFGYLWKQHQLVYRFYVWVCILRISTSLVSFDLWSVFVRQMIPTASMWHSMMGARSSGQKAGHHTQEINQFCLQNNPYSIWLSRRISSSNRRFWHNQPILPKLYTIHVSSIIEAVANG